MDSTAPIPEIETEHKGVLGPSFRKKTVVPAVTHHSARTWREGEINFTPSLKLSATNAPSLHLFQASSAMAHVSLVKSIMKKCILPVWKSHCYCKLSPCPSKFRPAHNESHFICWLVYSAQPCSSKETFVSGVGYVICVHQM